jgi:hypothetical protein
MAMEDMDMEDMEDMVTDFHSEDMEDFLDKSNIYCTPIIYLFFSLVLFVNFIVITKK